MEEVREESSCTENLTNYQHGLSPATITSSNIRATLTGSRFDASPQSFVHSLGRREDRLSQQFLPSYQRQQQHQNQMASRVVPSEVVIPMQAPVGTIMLAGDPYQPLQQSYGHPTQVHMVGGALGPR